MAVVSAAVLKSYFEGGDVPTCAQFVDLVDSTITGELLTNIVSAASAGSTGLVNIASATAATLEPAGSAGLALVAASTQASARAAISAASDASASTTQAGLIEIATTAEATAGTDATRAITPATLAIAGGKVAQGGVILTSSGTTADHTLVSSTVKIILLIFVAVSLDGTDGLEILLGDSGGFETANYSGAVIEESAGATVTHWSSGARITGTNGAAADLWYGNVILSGAGNSWGINGTIATSIGGRICSFGGQKTLSSDITQIRLKPTGANSFDVGAYIVIEAG